VSNQYSWVAEKKKEAMAQKLQKRGMPNYSQLPLSEKYGVSFTGLGQNGQLDRNAPAGMETQGRPTIYHEGELRANIPEGQMYANADVTQMMMNPKTIQERNPQSFAAGGFNPKTLVDKTIESAKKLTMDNGSVVQKQKPIDLNHTLVDKTKLAAQKGLDTLTGNSDRAARISQLAESGLTEQQPDRAARISQLAESGLTEQQPDRAARISQLAESGLTEQQPAEVGTEDYSTVQDVRNRRNIKLAAQAEPDTTTGTSGTTGTTEDQARNAGINWFLDALNKENPALMLEGRRAADELSSRQQQERSAMEQQLLQQGVDPGRARLEGQMLRDKQESEFNDLASKYGIAGMKARQDIAGTLASQGLAGQQFEELRNNNKDKAGWTEYEAAIAASSWDDAAAAYERVTGHPISMENMKNYQTYLNTKRGQDVTMGEQAITMGGLQISSAQVKLEADKFGLESAKFAEVIKAINNGVTDLAQLSSIAGKTIDKPMLDAMSRDYKYTGTMQGQAVTTGALTIKRLENDLGNEIAASLQDRINSGRSLEQINAEFPNAKLTMAEFQSMYDATPLGQKTFERKLGFANTLLQAEDGKGTNTASAVAILSELFPGTGIDFSGVVTTQKAATFNQGMSMLSDYVAAGMDWEEAVAAIEKNGTLEMLGLDKPATEKLYRSLKVNAIDEQLAAIDESTSLTAEEKADARIFATAVLTGKLDYKIQKEYTVTDKDGKITTMYMDSSAAASYATSNPGSSIVGTGKSKVVPITDIIEGTDEESDTPPTKRTEPLGTVIVEKGKIYEVIADGGTREITPAIDDPFSDDNMKILKAGEKDNSYYKTILDAQYKELTNDGKFIDDITAAQWSEYNLRADSDFHHRAVDFYNETIFKDYKNLSYDDPVIQRFKIAVEGMGKNFSIVKDGNSWKFV
jgi:hypothetical protein